MRFGGRVETVVLVALAALAFLPASAAANGPLNPITVDEAKTDAPLAATGDSQLECVSESTGEGCTLRAAVELANYESTEYDIVVTVDVPGETLGNTSPYGTFEVEPGARIIVAGAGAGNTKIESAGEAPRASIFTVEQGAALTLQNLTLLHGDAEGGSGNGGAIDAEGGASVTVEDVAIEDNVAEHDGGGVYGGEDSSLEEGASITIKHSTVTNNTAERSQDGGGGDGGGVYGEPGASITIEEESTIARNTAESNGGGVSAGTGELVTTECDFAEAKTSAAHAKRDVGSGSDVTPGLIVKHSKIEDNTADGAGGGGIYVSEGEEEECVREEAKLGHASTGLAKSAVTAVADAGAITIEQSQIEGNDAANGSGGGIAALNYEGCEQAAGRSSVTILQSTVADNTAQGEDEDGDGGGIYIETQGFECDGARSAHVSKDGVKPATAALADEFGLTLEQSTLAGNRAGVDGEGSGGGIYENVESGDAIVNSTIAENTAGEEGGGIYGADEDFGLLVSDTVSDNESEGGGAGNLATEEFGALGIRDTIVTESAHQTNCEGEIFAGGYNLDDPSEPESEGSGSDTCGLSAADHDLVGVEPGFEGGLGNHGGPTQTIALASTSAAIGVVPLAGDCEEASPEGPGLLDQRGEPRPGISGDGCDIGAYEYQSSQSQPEPNFNLSLSPASEEQEAGAAHTHSVTATVSEEVRTAVRSDAASLAGASVDVTFAVSDQNAGVTGTCQTPQGAADPTCATNSEGKVVFTYPDTNGAGSDTIEASALVHGKTDRATAAMTWKPTTTTTSKAATPAAPTASGNVLPFKAAVPPVCTSKRDITIHIQHVKQLGVVSAVVSIDGHAMRTLRGKRLTTAIDLRGLPAGTFTIEIVAHLRDGRALTGKRVYHTCRVTPLPGRSYLPL
jgi:hypothetical protein